MSYLSKNHKDRILSINAKVKIRLRIPLVLLFLRKFNPIYTSCVDTC